MSEKNPHLNKYKSVLRSAQDVAERVQNGDAIVISGGACQPMAFLEALGSRQGLRDVSVLSSLTLVPSSALLRQYQASRKGEVTDRSIGFSSLLVGPGEKPASGAHLVDFVVGNVSNLSDYMSSSQVDILVLGAAGMDTDGNVNLSCGAEWTSDILELATRRGALLVVEINPQLPWTEGETSIRIDDVDYVVEADRAIPALNMETGGAEEALAIGGFLASLVPDGATLQVGPGSVVARAVPSLESKHNLGVHTDFFGDSLLYLFERGAVTNSEKSIEKDLWVCSFALGSKKLYQYVDRNPNVRFHPLSWVSHPSNVARNYKMISVTEATEIDLLGQVAGHSLAHEVNCYPGSQADFHRGAVRSEGGFGIVVTPSMRAGRSAIVTHLGAGSMVTIPAHDSDCVVTEYGVARLRGQSMSKRVLSLVSVAHPSVRERLLVEARRLGLIR